jgi:hypothetical protein
VTGRTAASQHTRCTFMPSNAPSFSILCAM